MTPRPRPRPELFSLALLALGALAPAGLAQDRDIVLPRQPQVSPDGERVVFAWRGDIWIGSTRGGAARRVTSHPANDDRPAFRPDGRQLAFSSSRAGGNQIFVVDLEGGAPRQVTHDSHGKTLLGYSPDGRNLLVSMAGDSHFHRSESARLFLVDAAGARAKRRVLDAGFGQAALSPDGRKVLFTRGRASWWRKGNKGAASPQLWVADAGLENGAMKRLGADAPQFQNIAEMDPMWEPGGGGYYFVSDPDGTFDVYYRSLNGGEARRVTRVGAEDGSDDGVAFPSLSADGKVMVFRRRFQLHRLDVATGKVEPIRLRAAGDPVAGFSERRTMATANAIAFTPDGKQMAFVAGEDIYVMDRVLKEPVRVTTTPSPESSLVFSADGKRLFFVSDAAGEVDIWESSCDRDDGVWWMAKEFSLRRITDDPAVERSLQLSPNGKQIAYVKGTDLFVMTADGNGHHRVVEAWSRPSFDWAPDGKWLAYVTQDSDYNSDVWVVPVDGSRPAYNLSRHPDRDGSPSWSSDGKRLAFVSRRDGEESDIYYFNLSKKVEEDTGRDRKLTEALAAMKKKAGGKRGRGAKSAAAGAPGKGRGRSGRAAGDEKADDAAKPAAAEPADDEPIVVSIDFEGIHDRMHRISIADSRESGLLWSPDGKKLAFSATVDGERGFYTVEFPDVGRPKKLASDSLSGARWLKESKEIVGLGSASRGGASQLPPGVPPRFRGRFGRGGGAGVPAVMSESGKVTRFSLSIRQVRDWRALRQLAFDQGWRAMRDRFYDGKMNNRAWDAVRAKYRTAAAACLGQAEFSDLMNMMLGELNASHMGHRGGSDPLPQVFTEGRWTPTTYHLGLRYADDHDGPGLRVASVILGGPCAQARSRVSAGETVTAIDGQAVSRDTNLDSLLTLDQVRDIELTVLDQAGAERKVSVRPVASVRGLLYDEWVENTRKRVDALSGSRLGYLHIRGMNMTSFRQMEEDLYHAGHGKDGLIIDVRFNGGGSTTDHVLTALTQPVHAITASRGSGEGYPQDRKIYASWSKPIVVMCNQYSFSNAEILSHAIKQLGRGRVVGMRTGGGVISTGSQRLVDGSSVRMPTRGWYLVSTGEDMELNGCEPHIALWNPPGGADLQLEAAVKALAEDVAEFQASKTARPEPAAAKRLREARDANNKRKGSR